MVTVGEVRGLVLVVLAAETPVDSSSSLESSPVVVSGIGVSGTATSGSVAGVVLKFSPAVAADVAGVSKGAGELMLGFRVMQHTLTHKKTPTTIMANITITAPIKISPSMNNFKLPANMASAVVARDANTAAAATRLEPA